VNHSSMGIYQIYFNRYRVPFLAAVGCVFLEALCDLMQPTIMSHMIDEGVRNRDMNTVVHYALLMLGITAIGACFAAARNILAGSVSQRFGAALRYDVFEKVMRFSETSADQIESGSLITRITNDTAQITQLVNGMMRIFVKAPVVCLGSIALSIVLSPNLSVILLIAIIIVAALIIISMKLSYERFAKVQYAIDRVNTVVQESLLNVRLVKAFGRYRDEEEKFAGANADLSTKNVSSQLVIAYFSPLMTLTINLGIAAIIYAGSLLFGGGTIEVGKVSALVTYMTQILSSLLMITNVFNSFVRTKASSERIAEIFNSQEESSGAVRAARTGGALEFSDVTFAYPHGSGLPAIRHLSFKLKQGETVAIIGPTGAGKSTVAWLCLRFYDAVQGTIYFNDVDIKELDINFLRDQIALAPQKSMLFHGTVFENIAWSDPDIAKDAASLAARMAQAEDFILNMPEGYDSLLGQGGANLSGGQKQRISIARALAKQASLLILDDCMSALDSITEAKVRQALMHGAGGQTTLLITQRIGTAMSADRILVLDNGENVGFGSHEELLGSCRAYRELYASQIGGDLHG